MVETQCWFPQGRWLPSPSGVSVRGQRIFSSKEVALPDAHNCAHMGTETTSRVACHHKAVVHGTHNTPEHQTNNSDLVKVAGFLL